MIDASFLNVTTFSITWQQAAMVTDDSDTDKQVEKVGVDKKNKTGHFAIHYASEEGHVVRDPS